MTGDHMGDTKLIVVSQAVSVAFLHWLETLAEAHGPVELWTGADYTPSSTRLHVRRMVSYNKESYLRRLLSWGRFAWGVMTRLVVTPHRIPVLAITNPPLLPLLLVLHRVLFGRRYAIIEYDIYPQIMVAMGLMAEHNPVARIWRTWHAWSLRRCELVITLSDRMAMELHAMAQVTLAQLVVIPTWTDTSRIKPLDRADNPFAREHLPDAEIVVLYSGNLGATHSIETLLDVAAQLRHEPRVQFLIIGDGAKYAQVEAAITSGRTPNLKLLPLQPAAVVPYSLASANIAFVTLASGYENLSLPSKTYDMMAAGCAIVGISEPSSGLALLIEKHKLGRSFSSTQVNPICEWIVALADDRERLAALQRATREVAVRYFSVEHCEPTLTDAVLTRLCRATSGVG